jgi:hypothetical protein
MTEILNFDKINIDLVVKYFAAITTLLLGFNKVRQQFSNFRIRSTIKSDLEILRTCKESGIETENIKAKIDKNVQYLYANTGNFFFSSLTQILMGTILFIGFGLWSLKIYTDNSGFSPWIILTSFMSIAGLSMLFQENKGARITKTNPVFTINIYSWKDLITSVSIFTLFLALTIGIYFVSGFSYWMTLTVVLTIVGLSMIVKEIEIKIKSK